MADISREEARYRFEHFCDDCPKRADWSCSGADAEKCETEKQALLKAAETAENTEKNIESTVKYEFIADYSKRKMQERYIAGLNAIAAWWELFVKENNLDCDVRLKKLKSKKSGRLVLMTGNSCTLYWRSKNKDGSFSWEQLWNFDNWLRFPNPTYPTLHSIGELVLANITRCEKKKEEV